MPLDFPPLPFPKGKTMALIIFFSAAFPSQSYPQT
jgi:hypothetical protein